MRMNAVAQHLAGTAYRHRAKARARTVGDAAVPGDARHSSWLCGCRRSCRDLQIAAGTQKSKPVVGRKMVAHGYENTGRHEVPERECYHYRQIDPDRSPARPCRSNPLPSSSLLQPGASAILCRKSNDARRYLTLDYRQLPHGQRHLHPLGRQAQPLKGLHR